ncbi:probable protein phosphatase 2C 80 [Gastrolobium bilobum]|uniref:probable protein phosphatase 2C 80 n=1 Tax=Gastrolobium bilobum TaxID=150636 RepID=UPI002AB1BC0F|nr:probable protein phosphatase 2C 80 [Gastrolobium bilobum]
MLSGILSRLNATVYHRFREAITQQQGVPTSLYRNNLSLCLSSMYSTSFLPGSTHCFSSHRLIRKSMATSPFNAVLGDVYVDDFISSCGSVLGFTKPSGVYFKDRTHKGCLGASVNLRRPQPLYGPLSFGCSSFHGPWLKNFSTPSSACCSAGAAHDVSFDGCTPDKQLANSSVSHDQSTVGGKTLKMFSGSCYLPHPDKEETGGEDAHFICTEEQAIGVADGVGGWADVGVNAGLFAQELISHSVNAIQEEPKGSFNPARVLEKAHSSTKAKGSSTACIIALTDKGLHAVNLGDSGFIVVRDGSTIFRSPVQQHEFNFTYQLECGTGGDLPSSGEVFTIAVASGDVVVAGTDGLFDNLYNNEIIAVVVQAVRARLEPQVTAQKIAALARQRALDKNRQTPFSTAAQDAGFRYHGGKLDDITVVVSFITSSISE